MWGGVWWGGLAWGGWLFDPEDLGTFTLNLDPCFDQAAGYAGSWYAGVVYAGTPFCGEAFDGFEAPVPDSNVIDICINPC